MPQVLSVFKLRNITVTKKKKKKSIILQYWNFFFPPLFLIIPAISHNHSNFIYNADCQDLALQYGNYNWNMLSCPFCVNNSVISSCSIFHCSLAGLHDRKASMFIYLCSIRKEQPLISWIICLDVRLPNANQKYCTCDRETLSAGLNIKAKYNITKLKFLQLFWSDKHSSKCCSHFFQRESRHESKLSTYLLSQYWYYWFITACTVIFSNLNGLLSSVEHKFRNVQ